MVIEWKGKMIYIDPNNDAQSFSAYPPPDLVLITDVRGGYFNKETLSHIDLSQADMVAPKVVIDEISSLIKIKTPRVLRHGESVILHGVNVEALPTYRQSERDRLFENEKGNGYLLSIRNKRIYISGDTENFPGKHHLRRIDIAFICLNTSHITDIQKSANAILEIKPKLVYPYLCHETRESSKHVRLFKSIINQQNGHIEVRLRDLHLE